MEPETPHAECQSAPEVTVVVLYYKTPQLLMDCMDSLVNTDYPSFRILVFDNYSQDGCEKLVRQRFQDRVEWRQSDVNLGFGGGNNAAAQHMTSKYLALLNSDTTVDPQWLRELVSVAETDTLIGAVQPKFKNLLNPRYFDYAGACGGHLDRFGHTFARGRMFFTMEEDTCQYDTVEEIFWACGGAVLYRNDIFKELGGFDSDFFGYIEDVDLSWRMHLRGYKVLVAPAAVVYHLSEGSGFKNLSFLKHRNNLVTIFKNYSWPNLCYYFPLRVALDCVEAANALLHGDMANVKGIVSSLIWIGTHLPMILKKRAQVQRLRTVDERAVTRLMYPSSVVLQHFLLKKKKFSDLNWSLAGKEAEDRS